MTQIHIKELGNNKFSVNLKDKSSETTHIVRVSSTAHRYLTSGKISKAELLKLSFKFLLKREPKESILRDFAIEEITDYFPEFPREMKQVLGRN